MSSPSVPLLHESYELYRTRLAALLHRRVVEAFDSICEEAWSQCREYNELDRHLMQFQTALSMVGSWPASVLEKERDILSAAGDARLQDSIATLYVLQVRLLHQACPGQQRHGVTVELPDECAFLRSMYVSAARCAWRHARLYFRFAPPDQMQRNRAEMSALLLAAIREALDRVVPARDIQQALLDKHEEVREEIVVLTEPVVVAAPAPLAPMPEYALPASSPPPPAPMLSSFLDPSPPPPAVVGENVNDVRILHIQQPLLSFDRPVPEPPSLFDALQSATTTSSTPAPAPAAAASLDDVFADLGGGGGGGSLFDSARPAFPLQSMNI